MSYVQYYSAQCGGGFSDIGSIYHGQHHIQRGCGIGNFFSGLYRYLKPVFLSGIDALKDQSLKTGSAIIKDFGNKPIQDILKEQGTAAIDNLAEKAINKIKRKIQGGSGNNSNDRKRIKRDNKNKSIQLSKRSSREASTKKRSQIEDIFGKY